MLIITYSVDLALRITNRCGCQLVTPGEVHGVCGLLEVDRTSGQHELQRRTLKFVHVSSTLPSEQKISQKS